MELVLQRGLGQLPCFLYEQFCVCEKKYQQQEEKICWNDWEFLREFVSSLENKSGQIVGHIDSKTAKKWLDWDNEELYVVSWNGGFVFCFEGGTIVPV